MERSLVLTDLTKRYGSVAAVVDVSLTVDRGEFVTLLGPSGSGKTTILMAIAGFIALSSGRILLDGRRIDHLPPERRNFGMVFQGYALFPHLSVADNVAFSLKVRHTARSEVERRVAEVLDLVQLSSLRERLPRQLSGGQQQRVALARALASTPDLLLLDEPLSALDKKLRAELQVELRELHQRLGMTFLCVTHDQDEALSMSDRIAVLRDGRLIQAGEPRELYERPRSRFVADFLGSSNFLRGTVERTDDAGCTYCCGGKGFLLEQDGVARSPGEPIVVALRPEKITLSEREPVGGANRVVGSIVRLTFSGTSFTVVLRTSALGELTVTMPVWECPFEPRVGAAAWASWEPRAAVVVVDD
jgi:putative spermidine/putrescine transport system ATP-binding protein